MNVYMVTSTLHFLRKWWSLALLFTCLTAGEALGQELKLQNRPYIDLRKFHYGFMIGLHNESLHLKNNGLTDPETGDQWLASNNRFDPGFTVGILGEWRLHKHIGLRISALSMWPFATRRTMKGFSRMSSQRISLFHLT